MIKVLRHRKTTRRYVARVWLNDAMVLPDGKPDPAWVRTYDWPLFPRDPAWSDEEYQARERDYEQMQIRWLRRQAHKDLEEMQDEGPGSPVSPEDAEL